MSHAVDDKRAQGEETTGDECPSSDEAYSEELRSGSDSSEHSSDSDDEAGDGDYKFVRGSSNEAVDGARVLHFAKARFQKAIDRVNKGPLPPSPENYAVVKVGNTLFYALIDKPAGDDEDTVVIIDDVAAQERRIKAVCKVQPTEKQKRALVAYHNLPDHKKGRDVPWIVRKNFHHSGEFPGIETGLADKWAKELPAKQPADEGVPKEKSGAQDGPEPCFNLVNAPKRPGTLAAVTNAPGYTVFVDTKHRCEFSIKGGQLAAHAFPKHVDKALPGKIEHYGLVVRNGEQLLDGKLTTFIRDKDGTVCILRDALQKSWLRLLLLCEKSRIASLMKSANLVKAANEFNNATTQQQKDALIEKWAGLREPMISDSGGEVVPLHSRFMRKDVNGKTLLHIFDEDFQERIVERAAQSCAARAPKARAQQDKKRKAQTGDAVADEPAAKRVAPPGDVVQKEPATKRSAPPSGAVQDKPAARPAPPRDSVQNEPATKQPAPPRDPLEDETATKRPSPPRDDITTAVTEDIDQWLSESMPGTPTDAPSRNAEPPLLARRNLTTSKQKTQALLDRAAALEARMTCLEARFAQTDGLLKLSAETQAATATASAGSFATFAAALNRV